ncbi:DNA-binding transcriptional regulator, AcrR family [Eubacterium aggregans]|uniref:DNA-binding transcriptional regulator, AcrR family n=1 Tax=Eubacterium aggregans TaxID=81409 RepID=A0A1H4BGM8_9FIRM|nr:TetR/AcrR family transcriptional regulator [Eubacterium aggregans]SEA47168.1 DNA-binding transcriptional regulator, AcrR family [Eubacterium aggregans]
MKTRDKIVIAALDLFSVGGYSRVSVKDIAAAVGIKDASLYKHFKGKAAIFNTIVTEMGERMAEMSHRLSLPDANETNATSFYAALNADTLVALSRQVFLFYWKDDFAAKYRRMLSMEQFYNPEVCAIYRKTFMSDALEYQTTVFAQLIQCGAFIPGDPQVMAMNFYAPIFLLLSRYDGFPEKEAEALALLDAQVREFYRIYRRGTDTQHNTKASGL